MGTPAPSSIPGSVMRSDIVMVDVGRLMETVREEVTALMLDGVQKTASFCASQCAKHVVAARREMHQRLVEQKTEYERLHGVHFRGGMSPAMSTGVPTYAASPASTAFAMGTPRKATMPGMPPLAPGAPSRDTGPPASSAVPSHTPLLTRRTAPLVTGADEIACSTYDAYIGVHDAVQTLEERTQMALNAMEAIEEAISLSVDGAQNNQSVPGTPGVNSADSSAGVAPSASNSVINSRVEVASGGLPPGGGTQNSKPMERVCTPTQGIVPQRVAAPPAQLLASTHSSGTRTPPASDNHTAHQVVSIDAEDKVGIRKAAVTGTADRSMGPSTAEARPTMTPTSTVRILAGDQNDREAERANEDRRPGQAKFREHSLASTFSEAESIAPAHLQGL